MAAETRKSRKSNFSQEEVDVLITTVLQNHNILYGETSKSFFHKEIRNQVWNIILEEVNKVSLERRTLNEVKNKWKKCQYNLRTADHAETVDYADCDDLDSMPLQQRLSQNHNEPAPSTPTQEPVLQSQPISPTKLKVTRQGAKPQPPTAKPATPLPPPNPEVCLKWNSHHTNMQSAFPSLLLKEQYVDATLVSEGKTLKCHRMILSSCSPYFDEVLSEISPFQHPVLFMKDIPFWILKALCDFMYAGEVHIFQEKLQELLNVAETLKIKGLAGSPDTREEVKSAVPEIKQEIDATPPPKVAVMPVKEEKEEEPPPPLKPTKHETTKTSKKKEDKKSKHSSQAPKEKEKEKIVEEPPPKVMPKVAPKLVAKVVLPKMAPKVVPKVVIPKIQSAPKTTVKNVLKNIVTKIPKPASSKTTHASRKSDTSKKGEKHKADGTSQKEKEKEKDKPALKKDNINDPLDLLQPVYEEIAKEDPPPILKCINPAKLKERGNIQVNKRGVTKKVKKRRYAEYAEEREESPPPVFSSRKGTRSRPHVKIPKFFHTHYEESQKETTDATIVREPHTDQSDPLIGVEEVEEIKAEPLDVEENTIEMEENLVNYMQDQEMTSQEGEEIIGNYDSPIVNIKREIIKRNTPNIFKGPEPVIMNIHTVTEEQPAGLFNINEDSLKIVDISKISTGQNRMEETIIGTNSFDTTDSQENASAIMISNVQSMAEICEENRLKESEKPKDSAVMSRESEVNPQEIEHSADHHEINEGGYSRLDERFQNESLPIQDGVESLQPITESDNTSYEETLPRTDPDPLYSPPPYIEPGAGVRTVSEETLTAVETKANLMETDHTELGFKVENVRTDNSQNSEEIVQKHTEHFSQPASASGSLGSLEARIGSFGIESQGSLEGLEGNIRTLGIESQEINQESGLGANQNDDDELIDKGNDNIHTNQCETSQNLFTEDILYTEGAPLSDNTEQAGDVGVERQELMSVDSEREDRLESDAYAEELQRPAVEGESISCNSGKIQRTAERSDIGIERETISYDQNTSYTIDHMNRVAVEKEVQEPVEDNSEQIFPIPSDVNKKTYEENDRVIADEGPEGIVHNQEPTQNTCSKSQEMMSEGSTSQEMMSIGSASQEMMSIGSASQEMMSAGSASQERAVDTSRPVTSEVTTEKIQGCYQESLATVEQEEVIQNIEGKESPVQEEVWKNNSENIEIGLKDQNTEVQENEITDYSTNNIENTPTEIMSIGSESQNVELTEAAFPERVNEIPEHGEEVKNSETESAEVSPVDNKPTNSEGSEEISTHQENAACETEHTSKETTETIEAELEQCLASTSNIVPVRSSQDKVKLPAPRLSFEDEEDFTKDIEFDNYVGRNRPADYLGDNLDDDFEMEDIDVSRNEDRIRKSEEKIVGNEVVEAGCDDNVINEKLTGDNKVLCEESAESEVHGTFSDRGAAGEDIVAETENKMIENENMCESLDKDDNIDIREQGTDADIENNSNMIQNIKDIEESALNINPNKNLPPITDENADIDQRTPKVTANFNEHHDSNEDEKKMEDRLLADLDDDIDMKDASTSDQSDDGAEKTLEMIVNDLNESLGELKK